MSGTGATTPEADNRVGLQSDPGSDGGPLADLTTPRVEPWRDGAPPDDDGLARILAVAATVPDHGGLRPWRFAVVRGEGRDRWGDVLVSGLHQTKGDDLPEAVVAKMRGKAFAAPCSVVLIASPDRTSNVPVWEQVASASCTGYAIVLAAVGLGYGAVWKSAAVLDAPAVRSFFSQTADEQLLGWVNLGTPDPAGRRPSTKEPADLRHLVTVIEAGEHPFDPGSGPSSTTGARSIS
jgi:nitroreductase